jgi:hypothetical protein
MAGFPVWIDAPAKISLFAYDNSSVVVESFLDKPEIVTVSTESSAKHLRNAATGEMLDGKPAPASRNRRSAQRMQFTFTLQPHSFIAFTLE